MHNLLNRPLPSTQEWFDASKILPGQQPSESVAHPSAWRSDSDQRPVKLSTIIPAYNCETSLRRAVESLLATNDPDQEIVIVDDGSRDATLEIAHALQNEHPRIVSVKSHPGGVHCGVSATRNRGIEHSSGDFIALLDADDYVLPHRFESARKMLSDHPDVDGVYQLSALEFADDQSRQTWSDDKPTFGFTAAIPPEHLIFELLRGQSWSTSAIVFRRSLLKRSGLFEPKMSEAEDCHLWLRMAVAGKLVAGELSRPVSVYWQHGKSALQPSPEVRLSTIRAMTAFWQWLKTNASSDLRFDQISRSIADSLLNGISSARTINARKLAWKIAVTSAWQYPRLMTHRRWYGHVAHMTLGSRMSSTVSTMSRRLRNMVSDQSIPTIPLAEIKRRLADGQLRLQKILESPSAPRIALVKQDVCEDLYCGPSTSSPREHLESTQLRSGPIALLAKVNARFHILETDPAPECQIWMERALALHWETLEFYSGYRDRIPGCDYGQKRFAVKPQAVDWSRYDIVIGVDVAVPAAVTRRFPKTVWAYYVREIKAPSYNWGLTAPAAGQDLFLNHGFRWKPPTVAAHVVEFPYHLQYVGCFHELFQLPFDAPREGTFVDHHTLVLISETDRERLAVFGPVAGPVLPSHLRLEGGKSVPPRRTMDPDLRERLLSSKYFLITPGKRSVFGTALVEAIAAGCLAIGSPTSLSTHGFMFTPRTSADSLGEALEKIREFENDPVAYQSELQRQRLLIDWLCYLRPLLAIFDKAAEVVARRPRI